MTLKEIYNNIAGLHHQPRMNFEEFKLAIKSEMVGCVPAELNIWFPCTGNNHERKFYKEGYNTCRTETVANVEKLFNGK